MASRFVVGLVSLIACTPRGTEQAEPRPHGAEPVARTTATPSPPEPVAEPRPVLGLTTIAPGVHHTCALVSARVSCWGFNRFDKLGVGPGQGDYVTTPRPVVGLDDAGPIVALAADYDFTCALTRAGDVYCWGDNDRGQLGVGDLVSRDRPTRIPGLEAASIHLGFEHGCALTRDRQGLCWGQSFGSSPIDVPELRGIEELATPGSHSCTRTGGVMLCWGLNHGGQVGNGEGGCEYDEPLCDHCRRLPEQTCKQVDSPSAPLGLPPVTKIAAGGNYTYALDRDGGVWQWGQVGVTMSYDAKPNYRPQRVAELPPVVDISAGGSHVCARTGEGAVWCWGNNSFGQVGLENHDPRDGGAHPTPHEVSGLPPARMIAAGFYFTCALTQEGEQGRAWCWGDNGNGQLGDGTQERRHAPTSVVWD